MADELAIGSILGGKYRIEGLLGEGGMGVVAAARHTSLGELYAIKVLPATAGEVLRERFLREARASAQVRDPHVVDVYDVGHHEGATYMVMEMLDGEDLEQILVRDGPLPIAQAVRYARQACHGLAAAHALGVVHRDVKPSNLFIQRGKLKVLDFGISKEVLRAAENRPSLTQTGSVLGTPRYMSPEQLVSSRDVDARADVWSLGATLYELVTGAPAFSGESIGALSAAIVRHDPIPPSVIRPEIPPGLDAVILRCLEKDPDDRFGDVLELRDALKPYVRPVMAQAHRISVNTADALGATMAAEPRAPTTERPPTPVHPPVATALDRPKVVTLADVPLAEPRSRGPILAAIALVVTIGGAAALFLLRPPSLWPRQAAEAAEEDDGEGLDRRLRGALRAELLEAERQLAQGHHEPARAKAEHVLAELDQAGFRRGSDLGLGADADIVRGRAALAAMKRVEPGTDIEEATRTVTELQERRRRASEAFIAASQWGKSSRRRCSSVWLLRTHYVAAVVADEMARRATHPAVVAFWSAQRIATGRVLAGVLAAPDDVPPGCRAMRARLAEEAEALTRATKAP